MVMEMDGSISDEHSLISVLCTRIVCIEPVVAAERPSMQFTSWSHYSAQLRVILTVHQGLQLHEPVSAHV